jgi:hypothetical protein
MSPVRPQPSDLGTYTGRHAAAPPESTTATPPAEFPQPVNQEQVDPESVAAQREPRTSADQAAAVIRLAEVAVSGLIQADQSR